MINDFLIVEFGKRIRDLRLKSRLSQEKLAHKTGFHRTYIGMIERGERNISLTNMAVFAKVFDMPINELLEFNNQEQLKTKYQLKLKD
jgi:transcriptional regulator with XRE-family HTH domain